MVEKTLTPYYIRTRWFEKVFFLLHCNICFLELGLFTYKLFVFVLGITRKTRIIDVVYNASNNELVRTKTLVKNCIVLVDSTPFRQW